MLSNKNRRKHLFSTSVSVLLISTSLSAAELPSDPDRLAYQRPATIPFPSDNPYSAEKAALGKMLFFDTRLSRDRNISCASCHNPSFGWEVPFPAAIGAGGKPLGRHAPTVINLAWTKDLFWDGRADSLEAQARGPIEADVEMDLPLSEAFTRLEAVEGYQTAFSNAFPREGLNEQTILKAIATYERTIVSADTPFDEWMRGNANALSASAKRGFDLFNGKANCSDCHSGWNFTDDKFHDIGLATADSGRQGVTSLTTDKHKFKTPGLREIAARAPYMHNGSIPTLSSVIAHYISGGLKRPTLSALMEPLSLNAQELQDLTAFLLSLSSPQTALSMPNLPAN